MPRGSVMKFEPGTILEKTYKGKDIKVKVTKAGTFLYNGKEYTSLTAAVKKITGGKTTPASIFFKLTPTKRKPKNTEETVEIGSIPTSISFKDTIRMIVLEEIEKYFRS